MDPDGDNLIARSMLPWGDPDSDWFGSEAWVCLLDDPPASPDADDPADYDVFFL